MRKFICWLFGHRSICLYRNRAVFDYIVQSEVSGWKCERCGKTFVEQWDA